MKNKKLIITVIVLLVLVFLFFPIVKKDGNTTTINTRLFGVEIRTDERYVLEKTDEGKFVAPKGKQKVKRVEFFFDMWY